MDKKTMGNWIMYFEIQQLLREGLSKSAISKALDINLRTVSKYAAMSEKAYEDFLLSKQQRNRILSPYHQDFVVQKLQVYPGVRAAQMHDWQKNIIRIFLQCLPKQFIILSCSYGSNIVLRLNRHQENILWWKSFLMASKHRQILDSIF